MKRIAAALLAAVLLGACADEAAAPPAVPRLYDLAHDPMAGVTVDLTVAVPADRLRLAVQDLFEWHSVSLTGALRTTATRGPGQDGWVEQLAINSDELARAIGLVYGAAGARAFDQQWAQHTQFLVDYAAARQRGDDDAMAEARANLAVYERDAGLLLERATDGRLPAGTVESLLREHVERMIASVDATVADDPTKATELVLSDHAYLTTVADAIAGAFAGQFPARFAGPLDTADAEFCSVARRAVGAYTIGALGGGLVAGDDAHLVELGRSVASSLGAAWDPGSQLLGPWRSVVATDPDALAATVKRSLADTSVFIDTLAPGSA